MIAAAYMVIVICMGKDGNCTTATVPQPTISQCLDFARVAKTENMGMLCIPGERQ